MYHPEDKSIGIKMEHSVEHSVEHSMEHSVEHSMEHSVEHSEMMKLTNPSSATTVAPFKGRKKSPGVLEM
jgi:hypothetical protein